MNETKKIIKRDADFQKLIVLKTNRNKRHKFGEFIAEGVRCVNGAVNYGWEIVSFVHRDKLSRWAAGLLKNVETRINYELTDELMEELSGKNEASELVAVVKMKREQPLVFLNENPVLVLFDRPSGRGNLGTLLRSCDAFGADCLIITGHSADIYDPEVVAASAGSFFKQPFFFMRENIEIEKYFSELKNKFPALKIIATTAHDEKNIFDIDLTSPVLFLVGSETDGLSRFYYDLADVKATVPMSKNSSASSVNVSCAATVMLYEAARQRSV